MHIHLHTFAPGDRTIEQNHDYSNTWAEGTIGFILVPESP
jgi:hypothetical protein